MKYAFRMKKAHSGKTATDCGIKMGKSQGLFMKFRSRRGIFFRWPSDLHPTVENTPDDHQAAGRPALWPPARWRHGRRGRARRSSLSGRFRASNLERKTSGGREAHRELTGMICYGWGAKREARGVGSLVPTRRDPCRAAAGSRAQLLRRKRKENARGGRC